VGSITGKAIAVHAVTAHLAVATRSRKDTPADPQPKRRKKNNGTCNADKPTAPDKSVQGKAVMESPDAASWLEALKLGYQAEPDMQAVATTHHLTEKNDMYYRPDGTLYVPTNQLRQRCLEEMHDAPYSGHKGVLKTTDAITRLYWWPRMRADIKEQQLCTATVYNVNKTRLVQRNLVVCYNHYMYQVRDGQR